MQIRLAAASPADVKTCMSQYTGSQTGHSDSNDHIASPAQPLRLTNGPKSTNPVPKYSVSSQQAKSGAAKFFKSEESSQSTTIKGSEDSLRQTRETTHLPEFVRTD